MTEREAQVSDLLDKLRQFNQQYDSLKKFIAEGNNLLSCEKPVGDNATRVQEQMDTCQVSGETCLKSFVKIDIELKGTWVCAQSLKGQALVSTPQLVGSDLFAGKMLGHCWKLMQII